MQLTTLSPTFFKSSPAQAVALETRLRVDSGFTAPLHKCSAISDRHWRVVLKEPMGERYEWCVFADHVEILDGDRLLVWCGMAVAFEATGRLS